VVFGAARIVGDGGWMRPEHKLGNVHDPSLVGDFGSVAYYLEPEKADAENDPIQKIKIVSEEGKISLAGLKLMATESGGPVGQTTYLHAMFMTLMDICLQMGMEDDALYMARCALAMSILVQESVDNQKRATPYTDPRFAVKAENWIEVADGEYTLPKKHPARHMAASWYKNYEVKELDVARIRNWAYDQVQSVGRFSYLAELRDSKGRRTWGSRNITNWRLDEKTLNMVEAELSQSYIIDDNEEMVNLVGYCARVACGEIKSLVRDSGSEDKLDLVEIILNDILEADLGLDFQPLPSKQAKALKQVVGLTDYNKVMRAMMSMDPEHREAERTAAYHDLSVALSNVSAQQVLYVILDIIESTEQDDAGRLNNILKLVCTEGSPLKEAVGLGSVETCTYMSEIRQERKLKDGTVKISRARLTAEWLLKKQEEFRETGGYISMPALALSATGRTSLHPALEGLGADQGKPSGHLAAHGVEIHRCRACCDAVDKAVRGLMAPERESHRTALKRFITAVNHSDKIKKINNALRVIPEALRYTAGKAVVAEKNRWLLAMLGYKK
jgi:hypothetical protein